MLPPLLFHPILKPRAWGGGRLPLCASPSASSAGVASASVPIGESWEVADLDYSPRGDGTSIVAEGPFAGRSLHELRLSHEEALLGVASRGPRGAVCAAPAPRDRRQRRVQLRDALLVPDERRGPGRGGLVALRSATVCH